jgi:hypothetical protein
MVLTAIFLLSPATNSSYHRHRRIKVLPDPVGPTHLRQLDTSNGCQDHTASPSAKSAVRQRALDRSQALSTRPAITSALPTRCRVHRIPPRVRDDRDTPLLGDRTARVVEMFLPDRETKKFRETGLDSPNHQGAVGRASRSRSRPLTPMDSVVGCHSITVQSLIEEEKVCRVILRPTTWNALIPTRIQRF